MHKSTVPAVLLPVLADCGTIEKPRIADRRTPEERRAYEECAAEMRREINGGLER